MKPDDSFGWALATLALLQGHAIEGLQLRSALADWPEQGWVPQAMQSWAQRYFGAGLQAVRQLDAASLPLLAHVEGQGWGVIVERSADGLWLWRTAQSQWQLPDAAFVGDYWYWCREPSDSQQASTFRSLLKATLKPYRRVMVHAVVASVLIGLLTLAISLFSMQVYDRVIPTRSEATLATLGVGVLLMALIELLMKLARSRVMDAVVVGTDEQLSRAVFSRLLGTRLDQLPASLGSLAGQLRGYEQVRSFYTASTLFTLVDLPLGLLFVVIMAIVGSPWLALVPLLAALTALGLGQWQSRRIQQLAREGARQSNLKTGLLVEAVEGMETIKAGGGGWKFLSRWLEVNRQSISNDLQVRHRNDQVSYVSQTLQQLSYVLVIIIGAVLVMQGHMTTGALVACSILSGRVLAPIMALPALLVQHSHAQAAMAGLEGLYRLAQDDDGTSRPLLPSQLHGHYRLEEVQFNYTQGVNALNIKALNITAGDRIAIVGPIGSGKSTLLKLLAGLYRPQSGRLLLDGLELSQISRQVLAQQVAYLQQDHRLFVGTLRENLLVGMADPGDDALQAVMALTGLGRLVSAHPRGLDLPISEGGKGLSGGQKQLVAFTRALLVQPPIYLLDEPTAAMDEQQERQCIEALAGRLRPSDTLLVVTHKAAWLPLVSKVLVVVNHELFLYGPRDAVLERLKGTAPARTAQPA